MADRLIAKGLSLFALFAVLTSCLSLAEGDIQKEARLPLSISFVVTSSGVNESSFLVDGNHSTIWSSSERLGPGRREWIKLFLQAHCTLDELRLEPSPLGGFPTGFKVAYSTDGGETWYPIPGTEFNQYPDPGSEEVAVSLPDLVANALMIEAYYLRKDVSGRYTFQLADIVLEGSAETGPFFTSRGGQWDADLNMLWKIFGSAERGIGAVAPMGGESAWMEWNALKFCWYKDESLRKALRRQFAQYTVGSDGYVWSWGNQEGWPTHGHRHYESNAKFILGACRYYLWSGEMDFLESRSSATTDMAFAIQYEGKDPIRWDSVTHVAVRLEEGRTLGQSFVAKESFTAVGGSFPTYLTTGSGMTLRLFRDGPRGQVISERQFPNHVDNAWAMLEFDPQQPGEYYLEMSCPVGTIGWWSINEDVIPGGKSYIDGKVLERDSRSLLERLRSAMDFQLEELEGRKGLLVIKDVYSNGTHNGFPTDYWDNFPFGYKSAYVNIYFYASLGLMAEVEEAVGNEDRAEELRSLMPLVRQRFNQAFWDETKGRYIGCVDVLGQEHDYGFTYVNTEAMAYGLADLEKARRIYSWLDGEREISEDFSRGADIYHYVIAPRSTTIPVESVEPYWWYDIEGAISIGPGGKANYDDHLENGGIIFYTSYYDLLSRLRYISPDDALDRYDSIMGEFHKDQLRRDPPNSRGVPWKLGIIGEFPESGLVPSFPVHGFLGAEARSSGLYLSPRLPSSLAYMGIKDLWFRGATYTFNVTRIDCNASIAPSPEGYTVAVPSGKRVVIADGTVRELPGTEPTFADVREDGSFRIFTLLILPIVIGLRCGCGAVQWGVVFKMAAQEKQEADGCVR